MLASMLAATAMSWWRGALWRQYNRGRGHALQGRWDRAEPCFRASLSLAEKRFGPGQWRVALHCSALAEMVLLQGRKEEAAPLVARALAIVDAHQPLPSPALRVVWLVAAKLAHAQGDGAQALAFAQRVMADGHTVDELTALAERVATDSSRGLPPEATLAHLMGRRAWTKQDASTALHAATKLGDRDPAQALAALD